MNVRVCVHVCTRAHTHTQRRSWLQLSWVGGGGEVIAGQPMVSLTVTITYIPLFCKYNKHTSWLYQANLAQCCFISAVQPFSTQCGPASLLNSPIWSFNFLDLRAQPPPAGKLMTSLLNNGLFVWTNTPVRNFVLSSAQPHSHYFHSHHVFLNRGGLGKKENGTWHCLSTKDTLCYRVGTYGLRLLKDLECGGKYVKVHKKIQFIIIIIIIIIIICSLKFMEKYSRKQPHCKQTNKQTNKKGNVTYATLNKWCWHGLTFGTGIRMPSVMWRPKFKWELHMEGH